MIFIGCNKVTGIDLHCLGEGEALPDMTIEKLGELFKAVNKHIQENAKRGRELPSFGSE